MSEIDFESGVPIWSVEIFHNIPETTGVWHRVVNAETEKEAIRKAIELFESDGLPPARITRIEPATLKTFGKGGEVNGQ